MRLQKKNASLVQDVTKIAFLSFQHAPFVCGFKKVVKTAGHVRISNAWGGNMGQIRSRYRRIKIQVVETDGIEGPSY